MSPIHDKVTLCNFCTQQRKVARTLDNVRNATRSPQTPNRRTLRKLNLDQEIGNQAQVVDLAQFMDLVGGIVAQLGSG